MALDCTKFNEFLFRRVPDWDKELAKDRFPFSYIYSTMYPSKTWPSFTGTTHTWDKVHVTRPNDDGAWEVMNADACATAICDPTRYFTGWGSTRNTYQRYHRDYQTPVFCFDQLRNIEMAEEQLAAIIEGHKELPEDIISNFLRTLCLQTADYIHICGSALTTVAVTPTMFANAGQINLGGAGNLPTSKLNLGYLDNHVEDLQYQGYFKKEFTPGGMFSITTDIQAHRDLTVKNPDLVRMLNGADYEKGGKYFNYGWMMRSVGNWMFKLDPEPLRYEHYGAGVLQRVYAYTNEAATVGKKPVFSSAYKNAPYQLYHVYNREAREVLVGDTTPVNPEMKFLSRNLMGKWSWKSPDYFKATDPLSGTVCSFQNDKKNKGYFLAEFELGTKTVFPAIEMMILALREPQAVIDTPRCASTPDVVYQTDLYPYNYDYCVS